VIELTQIGAANPVLYQFSALLRYHLTASRSSVVAAISCVMLLVLPGAAHTQNVETEPNLPTSDPIPEEPNIPETSARLRQLNYIQSVLNGKLLERRSIGNQIAKANEQDRADLRRAANALTSEITQLRSTLETIATGGVDRKLFERVPTTEKKDWREDVSLIAQPVLDSLKEITEKPRRIKELIELIELKTLEEKTSETALQSLLSSQTTEEKSALYSSINKLNSKWKKRQEDAQNAIAVAQIQLNGLEGDQPISKTIYEALISFVKGRGLTILMAILAAWIVWFSVRILLNTYRRTLLNKRQADSRTRYRVAKYSVQALTFTLILIAVFIVFYERHDVLLLGLLILLIVGFVLNAKQLLPRYLKEARLLLNLGAMREGERVILDGIPFRVKSINMYTTFSNPELSGLLRIPLAELTKTTSRPSVDESWFPSSKGDVVLTSEGDLLEVLSQNPDTVELRKRGGELLTLPTTLFYGKSMTNLTRLGTFGVSSTFGVDYNHQSIAATVIPDTLQQQVQAAFESSNLAHALVEVRVELAEAGSSSINYWIFVTLRSDVAFSYFRVFRVIQSACIDTCTSKGWSIPFPHMSLVQKHTAANDSVAPLLEAPQDGAASA